jgi:hypothetical protein
VNTDQLESLLDVMRVIAQSNYRFSHPCAHAARIILPWDPIGLDGIPSRSRLSAQCLRDGQAAGREV